tara:strand:+ start:464 stop:1315 length:852 start_codon:yes stop_codon:yes gene_type:complete
MRQFAIILGCWGLLVGLTHANVAASDGFFSKEWHLKTSPSHHASEVIGGYASGCVAGAVPVPTKGRGYYMPRQARGKLFAHPNLRKFVEDFSAHIYNRYQYKLLISDLTQARGGPPSPKSGHKSHQNGLDVDIWYRYLTAGQAFSTKLQPYSLVQRRSKSIDERRWLPSYATILKEASEDERVERIFVNHVIKKHLCSLHKGELWLRKIRPWWGHTSHYHVRLGCPQDSPLCQPQAPVPNSDGCDTSLDWWSSEEASQKLKESAGKPYEYPVLHSECKRVFEE